MTSESTRFLGQPSETKPIFGRAEAADGAAETPGFSIVVGGVTDVYFSNSCGDLKEGARRRAVPLLHDSSSYWQPLTLNDPMRVCQLNVPLVARYSFVYQKVQSSVGSTVIAL